MKLKVILSLKRVEYSFTVATWFDSWSCTILWTRPIKFIALGYIYLVFDRSPIQEVV